MKRLLIARSLPQKKDHQSFTPQRLAERGVRTGGGAGRAAAAEAAAAEAEAMMMWDELCEEATRDVESFLAGGHEH
jgi:hypothetical protein